MGEHQPHIAVYSGAGIPARTGLGRIIDFHGNYLLGSTGITILRYIVTERNIAVGTLTYVMSIDPHFAVAIYAIKFNENVLILCGCWQGKCFAVPANTGWQGRLVGRTRMLFAELAFNAPIVRQS